MAPRYLKRLLPAFLLLIVALIVVGIPLYRRVQRTRDLNQTLTWIRQTYNAPEGADIFSQGHGWERHYVTENNAYRLTQEFHETITLKDGCNVQIHSETLPSGVYAETPSQTDYTFNLRDLDPDSIKIKTFDLHKDVFDCSDPEQVKLYNLDCSSGEVYFVTRDGATAITHDCIRTFTKLTGADHEARSHSKTDKLWLIADDVSYAQRLAKAWRNAIELCGGTPSKF